MIQTNDATEFPQFT